jgi:hypothetical protein
MSPQMPTDRHIVLPTILPGAEMTDELRAYFKMLGVKDGRHSTYAVVLQALGQCRAQNVIPRSLTHLFAVVGRDTRNTTYSAFTKKRANNADHDSVRERREVLRWLASFGPKFAVIDVQAPPRRGLVLKACLGTPCGLMPVSVRREEQSPKLLTELWNELQQASLTLPLVTTSMEALPLDVVLEATTVLRFDHFAVVSPFYRPSDKSKVRIEWIHPAPVDAGLGFSDSLQSCGKLVVPGGCTRFAVIRVNEEISYFAFGPSLRNNYYLQSVLPEGHVVTFQRLKERAAAFDSAQVGLGAWPIEQLRIAPKAFSAYARIGHAAVMAAGFTLFSNPAAAKNPEPNDWTRIYYAWDKDMNQRGKEADDSGTE